MPLCASIIVSKLGYLVLSYEIVPTEINSSLESTLDVKKQKKDKLG
jgi:hypothetical protein